MIPKTQGGGQGRLEKIQTEADFFFRWLPLINLSVNDVGVCKVAPGFAWVC